MLIRFKEITRGGGKIFIHLNAEGISQNSQLDISSSSLDGKVLPAKLLVDSDIDGYIAIVAVLNIKQKVKISVQDYDAHKNEEFSKIIAPFQAKLNSQFNTLNKNRVASKIRNCDKKIHTNGISVEVHDVIADADNVDIIHGTIFITSTKKRTAELPTDLKILDINGSDVTIESWITLSDSISQSTEFLGAFVRTINFSARIPHTLKAMIVWGVSSVQTMPSGFDTVEWFRLKEMRENWNFATLSADRDPYYNEWYGKFHRASERELSIQRTYTFKTQPVFSIIVPLYNTPIKYFIDMVDSVLAQTYQYFELILVNASPNDRELSNIITPYLQRDKRIKLVCLSKNLGITRNTNEGVKIAKGDFLCFLDHDDVIEPDILFYYAKGINDYPRTDLLYCDEDKLKDGKYQSPFFKPDWDPDLLCSVNYVCHMLAVRKAIVDKISVPLEDFDGAQDHNLTFLVSEKARNIYHVRRSLYHWRVHKNSTAESADAKSYTSSAGVRAVQRHLDRCAINGTAVVRPGIPNTYRIDYHFKIQPLISIVIPNKDMVKVLDRCIHSIFKKSTYNNYEIVIVENNSTDPKTFDYYNHIQAEHANLRVVTEKTDGEFNFSKTINLGFSVAKGDYLLMLNNDVEVISEHWMEYLVGPCLRDDVGAVGAKLLYPDKTIQHAGVGLHHKGPGHIGRFLPSKSTDYYSLVSLTQDYTAVTGACLMTKRSVFNQVGKLDEILAVDYNDIDFCLRLRKAGLHIVYAPDAELYHYESVSRGEHDSKEKKIRFAKENGIMMTRWPEYWALGDPYFNPNIAPGSMYHHLI
jgi:GT2 family glycosyltransferase